MRNLKFIFLVCTGIFLFSSNISYSQNKTESDSISALSKIWNKLIKSSSFSQKDLQGRWDYKSTACKFETENLLKKAGGALVATQVEDAFNEYCEKIGIKEGRCYFVFNSDSTYSAKLGIFKLSGKYLMDNKTKIITMSYALGIGKMHAIAAKSGNNLKLYFDADGFLKMMKTLSLFTNNNKVEILAKMSELYDGMLLGFDLDKDTIVVK
ncbi:conserved exported hypothetical protein [uncultured Paludibacter sp.]|nr:conserved exported hypothetical protein [uncultured Paludibacter sp.]